MYPEHTESSYSSTIKTISRNTNERLNTHVKEKDQQMANTTRKDVQHPWSSWEQTCSMAVSSACPGTGSRTARVPSRKGPREDAAPPTHTFQVGLQKGAALCKNFPVSHKVKQSLSPTPAVPSKCLLVKNESMCPFKDLYVDVNPMLTARHESNLLSVSTDKTHKRWR